MAGVSEQLGHADAVRPGAWLLLSILSAISLVSLLDRQILSITIEPIKQEMGYSDLQIGLLQGLAFAAFYAVFGIPIGWLVDRVPRRRILFFGIAIWGCATVMTGLSRGFLQMFAARTAVGVGEATVNPCSFTMIADAFPRHKLAIPMAVFANAQILGGGLSFILGGILLGWISARAPFDLPLFGTITPWRALFLVAGTLTLPAALAIWIVREPVRPCTRSPGSLAAVLERRSVLIPHCVGFTAILVMINTTTFWNLAYMARSFHWSPARVGLAYGILLILSMTIGNISAGFLLDRGHARMGGGIHFRWFTAAALIAIPITSLSYWTTSAGLFLAATGLYLTVLAGYPASAAASLQIFAPSGSRGLATGLYILISSVIGLGIGPMLVGLLNLGLWSSDAHLGGSLTIIASVSLAIAALALRRAATVVDATTSEVKSGHSIVH